MIILTLIPIYLYINEDQHRKTCVMHSKLPKKFAKVTCDWKTDRRVRKIWLEKWKFLLKVIETGGLQMDN